MACIKPFRGTLPRLGPGVYVAENATIIGDVQLGEKANIWYGAVLRGDVGSIRVGARTNVQDLVCIHLTSGLSVAEIGADVTVGHQCTIHGASIGDGALIGMGAIVLDNAEIGAECLVAAGSVVTPRTVVPPGMLVRGAPAKVVRELTDAERQQGRASAAHYIALAGEHRG